MIPLHLPLQTPDIVLHKHILAQNPLSYGIATKLHLYPPLMDTTAGSDPSVSQCIPLRYSSEALFSFGSTQPAYHQRMSSSSSYCPYKLRNLTSGVICVIVDVPDCQH